MSGRYQGEATERAWKTFFGGPSKVLDVNDAYPSLEGKAKEGVECGVDLCLLRPAQQKLLPGDLIQVKSSPAEALRFLQKGLDERGMIIPVVIGSPPKERTPEFVLRRLKQDYCWVAPKMVGERVEELKRFLRKTLIPLSPPIRVDPPLWVEVANAKAQYGLA